MLIPDEELPANTETLHGRKQEINYEQYMSI
jgi:hypothetical protein